MYKFLSVLSRAGENMKKRIAIVRGDNLNKWEMQNFEPLLDRYDFTAYTTNKSQYDITQIKFPVMQLPCQSQGLSLYMEGLEDHLADKDLICTADISWLFSSQAIVAKKRHGCRVVCLEWENIPFNHENNKVVGRIKDIVRGDADHFMAVTERAKEALMLEGIPEEMIDVIPMGVDLCRFKPDSTYTVQDREALKIGHDDIVVLFVGRMVRGKGIYSIVHAAARIFGDSSLKDRPIKFLLAGKGPELDMLVQRTADLGISDRFIILGDYPYDKMHRLHNLADIFILPSIPDITWQEQFGMVLVESMACGKPVISTFSGSITEIVGDAGILVQPDDHLSLYQAVKELISDKKLREILGRKALKRAIDNFDSRNTAERLGKVFEKVLSGITVNRDIRLLYEHGIKLWEAGELENGFKDVLGSFREDPDNKEILDSIVGMGSMLGKNDQVEEALKEYLKYHPADIDSLITLSEILFTMRKLDEAETELQKICIFEPSNEKAAALITMVKKEANVMVD